MFPVRIANERRLARRLAGGTGFSHAQEPKEQNTLLILYRYLVLYEIRACDHDRK
jgi:hypothetical protein